ncbi:DNA/RNA non-specific endonuclease [Bifidobacterium vansinderenii]|uniref:DNA/RNA non-specific endonuclease n=1 Tax=Bifidobacterium vansinderenii TaxID=1984871 RepID=A0A229W057_9BIFI|nr:DNA/RNA non-specific endonuclease [Bifidobacterium vansinderenii]OXN01235.1 DNA/RNA non-specific endonuclease [Bifidobacterium vansinderenii]
MTRAVASILSIAFLFGLAGCSADTDSVSRGLDELTQSLSSSSTPTLSDNQSADSPNAIVWSQQQYPDYYVVSGKADFANAGTMPAKGEIRYTGLDSYGRAGMVVGVIDKQLRDSGSARERDMPETIAGYPRPNPKVTIDLGGGKSYRGYLFNRSHLLAKSLGGEDAEKNMVTGTRTQNVGKNQPAGGMAYTETEARDWLDDNPNGTVEYMATPNYEGSELLPRTVSVDIRTSDGSIDQHVIVFNTANGYNIDYQNGGVK